MSPCSSSPKPASIAPQLRQAGGCAKRRMVSEIRRDSGPERRTIPMPPLPGGVETAAIVSSILIGWRLARRAWVDDWSRGLFHHGLGLPDLDRRDLGRD